MGCSKAAAGHVSNGIVAVKSGGGNLAPVARVGKTWKAGVENSETAWACGAQWRDKL